MAIIIGIVSQFMMVMTMVTQHIDNPYSTIKYQFRWKLEIIFGR